MRFSNPKTASRLRRPISESMTATFLPCIARAVPTFAVVVVLPTPPFPEVMVITRLSIHSLSMQTTVQVCVLYKKVLLPTVTVIYSNTHQHLAGLLLLYLRDARPLIQVSTTICPPRMDATSGRGCTSSPSGGRESRWAIRSWTGARWSEHTRACSLSG